MKVDILQTLVRFELKRGREVRVNYVSFGGEKRIDFRVWERKEGRWNFTERGFSVKPDRWIEFVDTLNRMEVPGLKTYLDWNGDKNGN